MGLATFAAGIQLSTGNMQAPSLKTIKPKTEPTKENIRLYNHLYARYHKVVYANIYKFVRSPNGIEDIFQDVFLALWENLHKVETEDSIAPWLFVVSQNKALTWLKKKVNDSLVLVENYEQVDLSFPDPSTEEGYNEVQMAIVNDAIAQLSEKKKQVFTLNKFEGLSVDEIASELNITPSTVREYLKQSVRSIKSYLNTTDNKPVITSTIMVLLLFVD